MNKVMTSKEAFYASRRYKEMEEERCAESFTAKRQAVHFPSQYNYEECGWEHGDYKDFVAREKESIEEAAHRLVEFMEGHELTEEGIGSRKRERARRAIGAPTGYAYITESLAIGINEAVTPPKSEEGIDGRHFSPDAVSAAVYLAWALSCISEPVYEIADDEDLTTTYMTISMDEGQVGSLTKFLYGRNGKSQRRNALRSLIELSRPVKTRIKYKDAEGGKNTRNNVDARIIRIGAQIAKRGQSTSNRITIGVCKLFFLDMQRYAKIDIKEWEREAMVAGGNYYVKILQNFLAKASQVSMLSKFGGEMLFRYDSCWDYAIYKSDGKSTATFRYREGCKAVAAAVANTIHADGYTFQSNGILFSWEKGVHRKTRKTKA